MSINSEDYRFFISRKAIGVLAYNRKYQIDLFNQSYLTIIERMFGIKKSEFFSDVEGILSKCIFTNDYQVVQIPNVLFENHGYDSQKVSDRFVCFFSQLHENNHSVWSNQHSECSVISVFKSDEMQVNGDSYLHEDTMIFAL